MVELSPLWDNRSRQRLRRSRLKHNAKLLLRNKKHDAVVALHDPASGRIFTTGFGIASIDR